MMVTCYCKKNGGQYVKVIDLNLTITDKMQVYWDMISPLTKVLMVIMIIAILFGMINLIHSLFIKNKRIVLISVVIITIPASIITTTIYTQSIMHEYQRVEGIVEVTSVTNTSLSDGDYKRIHYKNDDNKRILVSKEDYKEMRIKKDDVLKIEKDIIIKIDNRKQFILNKNSIKKVK